MRQENNQLQIPAANFQKQPSKTLGWWHQQLQIWPNCMCCRLEDKMVAHGRFILILAMEKVNAANARAYGKKEHLSSNALLLYWQIWCSTTISTVMEGLMQHLIGWGQAYWSKLIWKSIIWSCDPSTLELGKTKKHMGHCGASVSEDQMISIPMQKSMQVVLFMQ